MNENTVPRMNTLRAEAAITGLSYDHLRKLCLSGKIVYVRAGNKFLVNHDRLLDYLNTGDAAEACR